MAVTVQTAIKLMAMMTLGPESSKGEFRGVDQWGAEFNPLPAAAEEHLPHVVFQSACLEIVRYRTTTHSSFQLYTIAHIFKEIRNTFIQTGLERFNDIKSKVALVNGYIFSS